MTRSTRPLAGLLAGATVVALAVPTSAAVAQDATTPTARAATWLADQLVDGTHLESEVGDQTYVNYGPTADVALGLLATGEQPDVGEDVLDYLTTEANVDGYVHGGTDTDTFAGATAKLGYLVTEAGRAPDAVGGENLVSLLEGLEAGSGRYEDDSAFGDFSNVFSQAFGLLFLDGAPAVVPSDAAVQFLVDAQCPDGGFPESFGADACESSVDATGLALRALVAVDASADVRAEAAGWLVDARSPDGAWGEPANVNTTAYAGMGLQAAGTEVPLSRAFLQCVQNLDGGLPISPGGDSDAFATAQALPLLENGPVATPLTCRVAGENRRLTAVEISQADFADGAAATVVLTRDDLFADALAGTPLAVEADGPLLTTSPDGLDDDVLAEIRRVLPDGREVLVLGGPDALPDTVDQALTNAGYQPRRVFGATRFETSVAIARELGDPQLQLLTTGLDFADALTAGTAAASAGGAVLLTDGETAHPAVAAYLDAAAGDQVAVGGPAAAAHPDADPEVGANREATAVLVAERFFDAPPTVGVARLDLFADALAGGAFMGRRGGPLVLTATSSLPDVTADYLCDVGGGLERATVFGGTVAVEDGVVSTIRDRVAGTGC